METSPYNTGEKIKSVNRYYALGKGLRWNIIPICTNVYNICMHMCVYIRNYAVDLNTKTRP